MEDTQECVVQPNTLEGDTLTLSMGNTVVSVTVRKGESADDAMRRVHDDFELVVKREKNLNPRLPTFLSQMSRNGHWYS
jgi:hypothetical protein